MPRVKHPLILSKGNQGGFTMMEILVSMVLLAIVIVGLMALQLTTIRQTTSTRLANEATFLAKSMIEEHQNLSLTEVANLSPVDTWWTMVRNGVTMSRVSVNGETNGPFTVQRLVENLGSQYLITIRVSWLDVMPGVTPTPGVKYKTLDVLMSCRRAL